MMRRTIKASATTPTLLILDHDVCDALKEHAVLSFYLRYLFCI
jgi:hypothetical protein